jgi:LEM3-like protein/NUMOD3 motif-containing protein
MIDTNTQFYVYIYRDPRSKWFDLAVEQKENFVPFFVGKGKNNRLNDHLKETETNTKNRIKYYKIHKILNSGLYPIIEKYAENLTSQQAYELEELLTRKWGLATEPTSPLSNLIYGGNGGRQGIPFSDEHKKSLSQSRLNKIASGEIVYPQGANHAWYGRKHSNETKGKISNANTGKTRSEETKQKLRDSHKGMLGKSHSQETKDKLSKINTGKKASEETKQKISKSQLGVPHSEETRNKIRNATQKILSKTYEITFPDGHKEIITNLNEFGRLNNLANVGNLSSVASGKLKHYKGFRCRKLSL